MFLNTVTPATLPGAPRTRPCWVRTGASAVIAEEAEPTPPPACAQAAVEPAINTQARAVRSKSGWVMICPGLVGQGVARRRKRPARGAKPRYARSTRAPIGVAG